MVEMKMYMEKTKTKMKLLHEMSYKRNRGET